MNATQLQAGFVARQQEIIDFTTQAFNDGTRPTDADFVGDFAILAKANLTIPGEAMTAMCQQAKTSKNADFQMVVLARVLALAPGLYDEKIKDAAESLDGFWMNKGDEMGVFWSENHYLMQASIAMIMKDRLGLALPEGWRERTVFYLQEKIDRGFYEFNSQTYFGYSLAGLLNLYDFATDAEIKELARRASLRMLQDHVNFATESGKMRLTTGRSTTLKVFVKETQNAKIDQVNALLGLGAPMPTTVKDLAKPSTGFLATTDLQVGELLTTRTNHLDQVFTIGRTIEDFRERAAAALSNENDRITMSWTMGCYMHPECAYELIYNIGFYDMWGNHQFKSFSAFSGATPGTARVGAYLANSFVGSSILNAPMAVWRHDDAMLSSVQDYFRGLRAAQQFPWAAIAGPATVFTHSSGDTNPDFGERSQNKQSHLPSIKQSGNVALILYQPNSDLQLLASGSLPVSLHWPTSLFTEDVESNGWKLGRNNASFIALRPACSDLFEGQFIRCTDTRQAWAVVVGTEATHGSFGNFSQVVGDTQVEILDSSCFGARLVVDGQEITIQDWCQDVGAATILIACLLAYVLLIAVGTTVLCIKHRKFYSLERNSVDFDGTAAQSTGALIKALPASKCKLAGILCAYFFCIPFLVLGFAVGFFGEGTPATITLSALGLILFLGLHVGAIIYLKRKHAAPVSGVESEKDGYEP